MAIEAADYIDELNEAYPAGTEDRSTSDDHLRLLKHVLLTTLPNISGAITLTDTELNAAAILVSAPASASASGTAGEIAYDTDYFYVCTATNTWKRVAIATW